MATFPVHIAQNTLPELVARAEAGEEVIITRENQPVARIVALTSAAGERQFGAYRGKISVDPAFFDPLPDDELDAWE